MTLELFDTLTTPGERLALGPQAQVLRGFALPWATRLVAIVRELEARAPFRHMVTPGGFTMSVPLTNCGSWGWTSDRAGYRYSRVDPQSGAPWPALPKELSELSGKAAHEAGFPGFVPDACLVNRYLPGARMSLHQDKNERDFSAPIVSVSLGLSALFLFGGHRRSDRPTRVPLHHGDVVVWGGVDRLRYHGIVPLKEREHPLLGRMRINLTLRRAA